jgi:hypothetical protein
MSTSQQQLLVDFFNNNRSQLGGILGKLKSRSTASETEMVFARKLEDALSLGYPLSLATLSKSQFALLLEVNMLIRQKKKQSDAAKAASVASNGQGASAPTNPEDRAPMTDHLYKCIEDALSSIQKYEEDASQKSALLGTYIIRSPPYTFALAFTHPFVCYHH